MALISRGNRVASPEPADTGQPEIDAGANTSFVRARLDRQGAGKRGLTS